jgi:hypothetical protein
MLWLLSILFVKVDRLAFLAAQLLGGIAPTIENAELQLL